MIYPQKSKGRYRLFVWLLVFILFIILINFPPVRETRIASGTRRLILNVLYPVQYVFDALFSRIFAVFHLAGVSAENKALKKELAQSRIKELSFAALAVENERLRRMLNFEKSEGFALNLLSAKVIGRSSSNWFGEIIIGRGSREGVTEDIAVLYSNGVVGRVTEVGFSSSKVMLITDPASSVSCVNESSRDMGVVVGGAMKPLSMKYVSTDAKIEIGDIIVTSGMSKIFPPGIPIGTVTDVSVRDYDIFKKISVKPAVNFSTLEEVFVILR